jgi:hypothetical protein
MAEEHMDGRDSEVLGMTRRAAIGTGIAAIGVSAMWPTASASAAANAVGIGDEIAQLRAEVAGSAAKFSPRLQLASTLAQAEEDFSAGRNVNCRDSLLHEFVPMVNELRGGFGISSSEADEWIRTAERLADQLPRRDAPGASHVGNVIVFNNFFQRIDGLSVNQGGIGRIAGWSQGRKGEPPAYTQSNLPVPQSQVRQPGRFGIGPNRVVVYWFGFAAVTTIHFSDSVRSPIGPRTDVLLFLGVSEATIMTNRGEFVDRFPVEPLFPQ